MILYRSTFHVQHATKAIIKLFKQYVSFINFIVWQSDQKKYVFIYITCIIKNQNSNLLQKMTELSN